MKKAESRETIGEMNKILGKLTNERKKLSFWFIHFMSRIFIIELHNRMLQLEHFT